MLTTTSTTDNQAYKLILLCGPPGLGKTTLAHVVARHCGYAPIFPVFRVFSSFFFVFFAGTIAPFPRFFRVFWFFFRLFFVTGQDHFGAYVVARHCGYVRAFPVFFRV